MLVTFKFKDNDVLYAGYIPELEFKLENDELAIYKSGKFLGFYEHITGISEEDFIKQVENYLTEREVEVK